jgi:oligosaccharide repeat unit polymerase
MIAAILSLFLILLVIAKLVIGDALAFRFIMIYLGWWTLWLSISTLNLLGMYPVSSRAYFLLLMNVFFFTCGYISYTGRSSIKGLIRDYSVLFENYNRKIRHNFGAKFWLLLLVVYLFYYYVKYNSAVIEMGAAEARNLRYYVGRVFGSTFEVLFYNYLVEALAIMLLVLIAYSIVLGSVKNVVFLLAVIGFGLFALIGAGRTVIINAGLFIIILVVSRNIINPPGRQIDYSRRDNLGLYEIKRKRLVYQVIISTIIMVSYAVYITARRMQIYEIDSETILIAGREFANQVLTYAIGSFRMLDYSLNNPDLFGFHFGRLTLAGVDEFFGYALRAMGYDYPVLNSLIGAITQEQINIGSGYFNALYTCAFRFYYDFGYAGVMVLPFIFGMIVRKSIVMFVSLPCISTLSIMLLLLTDAVTSTLSWPLAAPAHLIFLAGFYLLYRKKRNSQRRWRSGQDQAGETTTGQQAPGAPGGEYS